MNRRPGPMARAHPKDKKKEAQENSDKAAGWAMEKARISRKRDRKKHIKQLETILEYLTPLVKDQEDLRSLEWAIRELS